MLPIIATRLTVRPGNGRKRSTTTLKTGIANGNNA